MTPLPAYGSRRRVLVRVRARTALSTDFRRRAAAFGLVTRRRRRSRFARADIRDSNGVRRDALGRGFGPEGEPKISLRRGFWRARARHGRVSTARGTSGQWRVDDSLDLCPTDPLETLYLHVVLECLKGQCSGLTKKNHYLLDVKRCAFVKAVFHKRFVFVHIHV